MKKYDVTVKATVIKTLRIDAETEDAAVEQAYEAFTLACDGGDEHYSQDVQDVVEVTDPPPELL